MSFDAIHILPIMWSGRTNVSTWLCCSYVPTTKRKGKPAIAATWLHVPQRERRLDVTNRMYLMKNEPHEYRQHRQSGPGAFLPKDKTQFVSSPIHVPQHKQTPVQTISSPPSLPAWADPAGTPEMTMPLPALNNAADTPLAQKNTYRWTKGMLAVSAVCLCGLALSVWLMTRGATDDIHYQVNNQKVTVVGGGIVFPYQQFVISYPTTERVVSVLVKPGDQVTPKQPLLQLDSALLSIQITQALNDVTATQEYLSSVSAQGNTSAIAYAQQNYEAAKNKYNALIAQESSITLSHGSLISPMSGVVTEVNVNPGEVFAANMPLITIMNESKVVVHVKIPLVNLQQVKVGQSAIVTPAALPTISITGVVSAIIPRADPRTDTFEVWVEVVNIDRVLLPGMSAFARIQEKASALSTPRLALACSCLKIRS